MKTTTAKFDATSIKGALLVLAAIACVPCAMADNYSAAVAASNPAIYFRFSDTGTTVTNSGSATTISGTLAGWTNATNVTQGTGVNGPSNASLPGLGTNNTALAITRSTANPAGVSIDNTALAGVLGDSSAITVEFFVNLTTAQGSAQTFFNIPIYKDGAYASGPALDITNDDIRVSGRSQTGDAFLNVTYNDVLPASTWTHLVVVYNFSGDTVELYKNGVSLGAKTLAFGSDTLTFGATNASGNGTSSLAWLGRNGNGPLATAANPIGAGFDEFAIYTQALSATEILAHYNAAAVPVPEPSATAFSMGGIVLLGVAFSLFMRRKGLSTSRKAT